MTTTTPNRPWTTLATSALQNACDGKYDEAGHDVSRLVYQYGDDIMPNVLLAWIDTALSTAGANGLGGKAVSLRFGNLDSGTVETASDVPPEVAWIGQLVAARLADDQDSFEALLASVMTSDESWTRHVSVALRVIALNINNASGRIQRSPR